MDALQNLGRAALDMWRRWTMFQRVAFSGGAALVIAAVTGVGLWASRPEFVMLADQLSPAEAADVVSALEAGGIEYQLNFSGSAVLVSKTALGKARLATKDVVSAATPEGSAWEDSLWADPSQHQARQVRELELRLARTMMQMRPVKGATVHIGRPTPSPFVRIRNPTKASVVLDLRPGVSFTTADGQSLVALMAHSVEGLLPENVSIVDTDGRQLSAGGAMDGDIASRLEYQQRIEAALASKAEMVLAQILGVGNSVVRVTAELDFTETTRNETTFDPEGKVKKSENVTTEIDSVANPAAVGAPGTASNLGSVAARPNEPTVTRKKETNDTEYENAGTTDTITEVPGKIERLTIAAVVHPPAASEGGEPPAIDPLQIEKLIKQAVGFDTVRNDEIAVMIAPPGSAPALLPLPTADPWAHYERLVRAASLGIGGLAALVLGWLVLRRLRPVTLAAPETDGLSVDAAHRLAELSQIVRDQPDVAARVLSAWMSDSAPKQENRRAA